MIFDYLFSHIADKASRKVADIRQGLRYPIGSGHRVFAPADLTSFSDPA